jgi:hypothetical protein
MIAHNVFFTLKDNRPEAIQAMVADCHTYLAKFPGVVFFAAGTTTDLDGESNGVVYDVALHVFFENREFLDAYMSAPRHIEFIEKHQDNWKDVQAYDSAVEVAK